MPIDAVKIPQNVYIEDRIVGPLTLRQILTVALGGGFSYILYITAQKIYGTPNLILTIILWIPAALSVVFAFVTVNDLSILRLLLLAFESMNKPATRVFEPRVGISVNIKTAITPEPEKKAAPPTASATNASFADLSVVLDRSAPRPITVAAPEPEAPAEPVRARSSILSNPPAPAPLIRDLSA
ncbi:MAG: PrgI family protein [Candidatus Peribacteraceae bacterium]|nr:PrgI family protein [Candidatus Peribacteraceae bacterium]